jgi:hypothetical protein
MLAIAASRSGTSPRLARGAIRECLAADFGLAKALESDLALAESARLSGLLHHMDLLAGKSTSIDMVTPPIANRMTTRLGGLLSTDSFSCAYWKGVHSLRNGFVGIETHGLVIG